LENQLVLIFSPHPHHGILHCGDLVPKYLMFLLWQS